MHIFLDYYMQSHIYIYMYRMGWITWIVRPQNGRDDVLAGASPKAVQELKRSSHEKLAFPIDDPGMLLEALNRLGTQGRCLTKTMEDDRNSETSKKCGARNENHLCLMCNPTDS